VERNTIVKLTGKIRRTEEGIELVCHSEYLSSLGIVGEQVFECASDEDAEYEEYASMIGEEVEMYCRRIWDNDPNTAFSLEILGRINKITRED
jgi:hypothetical protein